MHTYQVRQKYICNDLFKVFCLAYTIQTGGSALSNTYVHLEHIRSYGYSL